MPDRSARAGAAKGQDRDIFTGVIGAMPCRVAPVIRCDDRKILRAEQGVKCGQPPVEILKRSSISCCIPPMAEKYIKVDEIGNNETILGGCAGFSQKQIEQRVIVRRLEFAAGAVMGKDITNLANRDNGPAAFGVALQQQSALAGSME